MAWQVLVLNWLVHAAVGGSLVLLVGCIAVACCRQPVRRVRLIELTLAVALLAPLIGRLPGMPQWSAGWLALDTPVAVDAPVAAANEPDGGPPMPRAAQPIPLVGERQDAAPPATAAPKAVVEQLSPAAGPAPAVAAASISLGNWLALAYAGGVMAFVGWWLVGLLQLARLSRSSRPASPELIEELRALAGPGADCVRLLISDHVEVALTFTGRRPVIVLPASLCSAGDVAALRFALAHEWCHVQRRDALRWYLATLARALLFFQPLAWWLRRQLRLCQDYLADAQAAEQAAEATDYADYLVALARRGLGVPTAALSIAGRRSNLYRRVVMLLQNAQPLERCCRAPWNVVATLGALTLLAAVAAVRLDARAPEKADALAKEAPKEKPKEEPKKVEALHYTGIVKDKDTGKPLEGAVVTVRRSILGDPEATERNPVLEETKHTTDKDGKYSFTIPPEQASKRYLYIELDAEHPDCAPQKGFGYALGMILKNEKLGGRPFFEDVRLRPGKPISAVVQMPDGKPAAGVKVLAYSVTSNKSERFEYGSFADTTTDAGGRFRLVLTTPGAAVFWILPPKHAPSRHVLKKDKRGDLGTFGLHDGIVLRGKVLDAKGKPVAGVNVNADIADRDEDLQGLNVADSINRSGVSDDKGEFVLAPLPPGSYSVKPDAYPRDSSLSRTERKVRPVAGVYLPLSVKLTEGKEADPIEVRAVPHVTIEAQYYNAKGEKTRGHAGHVFGQMDKKSWFGEAKVDKDGKMTIDVPHGLERVQFSLMTNEHGVLRWRKKAGEPLQNGRDIRLETVNDDVKGIEIIHYKAPILIVAVKAKDGGKLDKPAVTAVYGEGRKRDDGQFILANGRNSDVSFEHQEDGRFRSSQMLPDEDVIVSGHAEGYKSRSETVKLAEATTKEIVIELEKGEDAKEKK